MVFFKGRDESLYILAKYYIVLNSSDWSTLFNNSISELFSLMKVNAKQYSLNYSSDTKLDFSELEGITQSMSLDEFEYLSVGDSEGFYGLTINKQFAYLHIENLYEFRFVYPLKPNSNSPFTAIARKMMRSYKILYGYGRFLKKNIEPASENKIKKNLFGNITVNVNSEVGSWMENPVSIMDGSVKGVYSFNLMLKPISSHGFVKELIDSNIGNPLELDSRFVTIQFSQKDLKRIKKLFRKVTKYIHL